jgi:hypothetical protein
MDEVSTPHSGIRQLHLGEGKWHLPTPPGHLPTRSGWRNRPLSRWPLPDRVVLRSLSSSGGMGITDSAVLVVGSAALLSCPSSEPEIDIPLIPQARIWSRISTWCCATHSLSKYHTGSPVGRCGESSKSYSTQSLIILPRHPPLRRIVLAMLATHISYILSYGTIVV